MRNVLLTGLPNDRRVYCVREHIAEIAANTRGPTGAITASGGSVVKDGIYAEIVGLEAKLPSRVGVGRGSSLNTKHSPLNALVNRPHAVNVLETSVKPILPA